MRIALFLVLSAGICFSAFSSTTPGDSATFYLGQARQLFTAKKYWEADKNFQKAITFNPANEEVRLAYADYLLEQRKHFAAVEQVSKILEKNLNHKAALSKMTELSFQLRRWNDVIIYGNKLMQNGSTDKLKFMMGKSYFEIENYGQSQKMLQAAVAENPANVAAVTLLGKVLIEVSDYKQAIAVYTKTLQMVPNDNQLIYELGLLYYTMNNEKEATKYFEMAVEKGYKADLDYYENLGLAYLGFDLKRGVETLQKVLVMKPGNPEILFQVAQSYFKAEDYKNAADSYYKVYENDNSNSRALYMTGVAYQKKGDKNKGISYCEQAIRMDPNLAQLRSVKSVF